MDSLYQILGLIGAGLVAWLLYRTIKSRPEQFSRENLNKSFATMGILAIALIVFVALLVLLVNT
ncbi:MAG: hypothetical protein NXI01_02040 [Gammaproteobacteria bacterium]|nr:hypothetical protein [Gammaproteobacteria bacterium]